MVVIRLTRIGKKKQAQYRVVVADSQRSVSSKFISIVGWYNPHTKEVELKKDEIVAWMGKGAQPSNTVAGLLKANGVKLPDWVKITEKNRKPKKEPVAKPEKVEAPAETEAEETPTEEAPAEENPSTDSTSSQQADAQDDTEVPETTTTEDTEKSPE